MERQKTLEENVMEEEKEESLGQMEEERSQQQFCFLEEDEGKKTKKG
jgi:hypothetical protein